MITEACSFEAIDGMHSAILDAKNVSIKMASVGQLEKNVFNDYILDTGSPHYISFVEDLSKIDIVEVGKNIRYSPVYSDDGINVNVGCIESGKITLLTYERGVEDETYSCGTGATAAVIAYAEKNNLSNGEVEVLVKGGALKVKFNKQDETYDDIWLTGPAIESFRGTYG
jgi:diaminopimelate epimerase